MRQVCVAAILALVVGCNGPTTPTPRASQPDAAPLRVLMLTATAGFRHDSISTAREVMNTLADVFGRYTERPVI